MVLRGRDSDPAAALSGSQSKAPGFAGGYLLCDQAAERLVSCSPQYVGEEAVSASRLGYPLLNVVHA